MTSQGRSLPVARAFPTQASRFGVTLCALAILFWRTPSTFTQPQFWGEDADFFYRAYFGGWKIVTEPVAGYLVTIQSVVAAAANSFPPPIIPAFYNYTAVLLTLAVVWMVTSPRLEMPYKPLLAIAIVVVPMGFEELGTITNIQWIMPIGVFVTLFMAPARSALIRAAEAIFVALSAVSGPFSILLSPLFIWRLVTSERTERSRSILLTTIVIVGALIQFGVIIYHRVEAIEPVAAAPYSWALWFTLPLLKLLTTFQIPARGLSQPWSGVPIAIVVLSAIVFLSFLKPYRLQKAFMIVFGLSIALSGMYKFRMALESQIPAQRYFYVGCVFSLWFLCCIKLNAIASRWSAIAIAILEASLLPSIYNTPRIQNDLEWPIWARHIASGLPVMLPSSPPGFFVQLPAAVSGPLSRYKSWLGRDIDEVSTSMPTENCSGAIIAVEPVLVANPQSVPAAQNLRLSTGHAWHLGRDRPVELVLLVDQQRRIAGFGLPGFAHDRKDEKRGVWKSFFHAHAANSLQAYAVTEGGRGLCKLS